MTVGTAGTDLPGTDEALARRVEVADVEYVVARLMTVTALPANPHGARVTRIGSAVALRAPGIRNSMFQRLCMPDDSLLPDGLDGALEAATSPGLAVRVDVLPPLPCARLLPELSRRGFRCAAFYAGLYGLPRTVPRRRPFAGVVRSMRPDEIDEWCAVYARGFGFNTSMAGAMEATLRGLPERSEAEFLVAVLDGRIAAVATLWVHEASGYLAVAATLPEARGRGCHAALLDARILRAAERGCDLIAAHAAVGSASQRNMERAGLRLAFHKSIWMKPPAPRSTPAT